METVNVVSRSLKYQAECKKTSDRPSSYREFSRVEDTLEWFQSDFPNSVHRYIKITEELKIQGVRGSFVRMVERFHWLDLFPGTRYLDRDSETTKRERLNRDRFAEITGFNLDNWMSQNILPDFNTSH